MDKSARVLNVLLRASGGAALLLGLMLWLGYAPRLTRLHIGFGIALVAALWALAGVTWIITPRRGLAALAAVWGLLTWAFGITQSHLLAASVHWIAEVAHLATGVITIALGTWLANAVARERKTLRASI